MEERNPVPMTPGGGRVYRTEVVPYDARHDAEARNREAPTLLEGFRTRVTDCDRGPLHAVLEQEIEIPFAWTDGMSTCTWKITVRPTRSGSTTARWPRSATR